MNIAITGEMGAGKSEVVKLLQKMNFLVFSADKVIAELYKKKWFCKKVEKIIAQDVSNNVKDKIKNWIKSQPSGLQRLESFIHPYVKRYFLIKQKINKDKKIVFFEVPLLFEVNMECDFDKVIFVKSSKISRYERIKKTREFDRKLLAILENRFIDRDAKESKSDYIIDNDRDLSWLELKVKEVIRELNNE